MIDKTELRTRMIQTRLALSMNDVKHRSAVLVNRIRRTKMFKEAHLVALYYPIRHEVDLRSLFDSEKRIALPKVVDGQLHFIEITADTELVTSAFGIKEPQSGPFVDDQIDLLLVPAIAMDKDHYRIGYGKGFFDMFLTAHHPRRSYGVIYDFQLVDAFPHEEYDIPLDGVFKV